MHRPANNIDQKSCFIEVVYGSEAFQAAPRLEGTPPPEAVCCDLLIGFKSMAYVMHYSDFPH